jgi:hypothetical protein
MMIWPALPPPEPVHTVSVEQIDLAAFVECRTGLAEYNGFAFRLAVEPDLAERQGWRRMEGDNPFLSTYRLPAALSVFGQSTSTIAFTATGPMAVLEGIDAADLARQLGVVPVVATPEKFLGEKVIQETAEDSGGTTYLTRISLNVSTVEELPGKVLAGCSYVLDVK